MAVSKSLTGATSTDVNGSSSVDGHSNDAYLAKPSGSCCLQGSLHEGKPRGSWLELAGVETYMAEPPANKANGHILFYFPDVRQKEVCSKDQQIPVRQKHFFFRRAEACACRYGVSFPTAT